MDSKDFAVAILVARVNYSAAAKIDFRLLSFPSVEATPRVKR